tara:strand:- start:1880 stop:2056 length:177 start_codon:yes stop_codon:yes gene_type:complete
MRNTMRNTITDTTQVAVAQMGAISVSLSQVNEALSILSYTLAILFTIYKFSESIKNKK